MLPTTPITTAPVNSSVMSSTVHLFDLFDHCVDSLRTSQVLARLVAFGDISPLAAVGLAALVLVTGFRTTPCTCVSTTAGATAIASVTVLDTTAFTTSRTLRHSIAVEAPGRRVPRRPFPFACAPGFFVPDRLRGLWFSHRTQLAAGVAQACACHAFPCALDDTGCRAHAGTSVFSRAYTPFSHPWRPRAVHAGQSYRIGCSRLPGVGRRVTPCMWIVIPETRPEHALPRPAFGRRSPHQGARRQSRRESCEGSRRPRRASRFRPQPGRRCSFQGGK